MALTTNQLVYGIFGIAAGGFTDAVEEFVAVNGEDFTADTLMSISFLNPSMLGMPLYSNGQYATALVGHLMGGLDDTLEEAVVQMMVNYMAGNPTLGRGAIAVDLIEALLAMPDGDRNFGDAKAEFLATVALADAYTGGSTDLSELAAVVSENDPYADQAINLTVGLDVRAGTSDDDTFNANVVQNDLGLQVNTLGSGDELSGSAGNDVLNAKITTGAYAGGSDTMPIQPETSSIETINLQAVLADINSPETVYVNAKDMLGVDSISSVHSDASLVVQNMTTLGNDGSTRALSEMTVGMKYTGNSDSHWDESNMAVYFDQDYLNPELVRGRASVSINVMNEDAYDLDNTTPLAGVEFGSFYITVNGTAYDLANNDVLLGSNTINAQIDANGMETYADLLAYVSNAIGALKAAFPADAALQTLQAELGNSFTSDEDRVGTTLLVSVDAGTAATPNTIEATEVFDAVAMEGVFLQPISDSTIPNSNRYESAGATPADEGQVLEIDIDLEKVGLAGDGGSLVVGSMYKDGSNVWSDEYAGKGIEQFNVTVYGNDSKPSSLSSLASTGNNLRVVNVVSDANQTGTFASLTIGNSNTDGDLGAADGSDNTSALKDVQTFDATGFDGDLTLFAGLSDEIVAKYLDRRDDDADPFADNEAFTYSGGTGNDSIDLAISSANLAAAGTATREDMSVTMNGGAGDDSLTLAIHDDDGSLAYGEDSNWYDNQAINANLAINGGDGNDTIWTPGSGNVVIDGGDGDDAVYADNTGGSKGDFNGGRATWVFNAVNTDVDDLLSNPAAATVNAVEAALSVTFMGFSSGQIEIADSWGKTSDVAINDLHVNQAIKDAINNDAVLSKLLVAEDGPARTLVVRSLIDGADVTSQLVVDLGSHSGAVAPAGTTLFGAATNFAALEAVFENEAVAQSGDDSYHTSDNEIEGNDGNDVIVLGTGEDSNDTLVYNDYSNDTDSIVHFEASGSYVVPEVLTNLATVSAVVDGTGATAAVAAVAESFTLTLTGSVATVAGTITLSGAYFNNGGANIVISPIAGDTVADVALALANANNGAGTPDWTAVDNGDGTVTFTAITAGAVADVTVDQAAADVSYDLSGVGITMAIGTDGADLVAAGAGTAETFDVTFADATQAGTYTFAGVSVDVLAGETGENIAAAFAAATSDYTGWTAAVNAVNTVTFTNDAVGNQTDITDASFVGANVVVTPETTMYGFMPSSDMIDFSSYDVAAVYVGASLVTGAAGGDYIVLTENSSNAGAYTAVHWEEAGTTDVNVGTIGVLDFGATQAFVADNFIV